MIESLKQINPKALEIKLNEAILSFKEKQFLEKVKEEFKTTYPDFTEKEITNVLGDVIGVEKNPINYNEYDSITTDSSGNEVKNYINKYDKALPDRPTLDYFIQLKRIEYKPEILTDADYNLEPLEINTTNELEKQQLEELNKFKQDLKELILLKIQEVADISTKKAMDYLAGAKNLTQEQVDRYLTKYEVAKKVLDSDENAISLLSLEATLVGLDVKDLAYLIIKLHDDWTERLKIFNLRIDAVRTKVKNLVGADTKKAIHIISIGSQLKADVTDKEILELFK